jgi:hypothetical protein
VGTVKLLVCCLNELLLGPLPQVNGLAVVNSLPLGVAQGPIQSESLLSPVPLEQLLLLVALNLSLRRFSCRLLPSERQVVRRIRPDALSLMRVQALLCLQAGEWQLQAIGCRI